MFTVYLTTAKLSRRHEHLGKTWLHRKLCQSGAHLIEKVKLLTISLNLLNILLVTDDSTHKIPARWGLHAHQERLQHTVTPTPHKKWISKETNNAIYVSCQSITINLLWFLPWLKLSLSLLHLLFLFLLSSLLI